MITQYYTQSLLNTKEIVWVTGSPPGLSVSANSKTVYGLSEDVRWYQIAIKFLQDMHKIVWTNVIGDLSTVLHCAYRMVQQE